jgi:hypothetical protein
MNAHDATEIAYERGYNQAVRDIFAEIEAILHTLDRQHMLCGNPKQAWGIRSAETKIAELKKKYVEGEEHDGT